jgi:hypothetical protein
MQSSQETPDAVGFRLPRRVLVICNSCRYRIVKERSRAAMLGCLSLEAATEQTIHRTRNFFQALGTGHPVVLTRNWCTDLFRAPARGQQPCIPFP